MKRKICIVILCAIFALIAVSCADSQSQGTKVPPQTDNDPNIFPAFDETKEKWGYIDINGEWVIEPQYNAEEIDTPILYMTKQYNSDPNGSNEQMEYQRKQENNLWGIVDKNNNWVIKPQYEDIRDYSEGLVGALENDKWGFINLGNQWEIEPQYDPVFGGAQIAPELGESSYIFFEGISVAVKFAEEKMLVGCINIEGNWVVSPEYQYISPFHSKIAFAVENSSSSLRGGIHGYIDQSGEWIFSWRS